MMMKKATVLFFAADPHSVGVGAAPRLQLDEEVRTIREHVRKACRRDVLDFKEYWATRADDLLQALGETRPRVVHFSGHGGNAGLVLVGSTPSQGHRVGAEALAQLFQVYRGDIRVVVLNACQSLPEARAIAAVVGCAIGARTAITDDAAIAFGSEFYGALACGDSVQTAFDRARAALAVKHFEERDCPQLVMDRGVDARKLFVVEPKRRQAGLAAAGLVGAVVVGAMLIPPPPPPCAWAGEPHPLAQPASSAMGLLGVQSDLDRAKVDYEARRYEEAFPRFKRLAESGDPEAMGFVGVMLLRGRGTAAHPKSGIYWLRKAAYKRDLQAMLVLASAYQNADGVDRSLYYARDWYNKAADEKHSAEAMRALGAIYLSELNYAAALDWFERSVKAGSLDARIDAAQMYEQGQGTSQNLEEAVCLYRTAAEAGSLPGMFHMGRVLENGIGVDQDYEVAAEWYEKAANQGVAGGMRALGKLYLNGLGVRRDSALAELWFRRAEDAGRRAEVADRTAPAAH